MSKRNKENPQEIEGDEKRQKFPIDDLFQFAMKQNWPKVLEVCERYPSACKAKLTKTEETALHIAVSNYYADGGDANEHANAVRRLVNSIPEEQRVDILKCKNDKGDTPLHIAAALGSNTISEIIARQCKGLIDIRNLKGETPLFLAAHHGNMDAFLCLLSLYKDIEGKEPDDSLCRRTKDGDTILHSAISGEYFELANKIIIHYKKLINSVNQEGFSPLHILARKPNVFPSSSKLRLFDHFLYSCIITQKLKKQTDEPLSHKISPCCRNRTCYPENYRTCMNLFCLPWAALRFIAPLGKDCGTGEPCSCIVDEENPNGKDKEHEGKGFEIGDSFPPNYATCILVFKLFLNIVLTMLGIGIWRIGKIKEKKEKHNWAVQIMTELISVESNYKYGQKGGAPTVEMEPTYAEGFAPPTLPPEDCDNHSSVEESSGTQKLKDEKAKYESRQEKGITEMEEKTSVRIANTNYVKETPILLAAKMGITEMVKMILETFPVAIEDLDENGKNALLLAVENRQTEVYDLLMNMKLPEFAFYQVDNEGNSALHLAAKFQKHQPWRIPGPALRMQWAIKWYKHVKHTMPPQSFIQYNHKGETAREIFRETHKVLVRDGREWLRETTESCSVVAALIATLAFPTSATVPGGVDQNNGRPILENQPAFQVFAVASAVALCFSITALVFFIAIHASRCQLKDFRFNLPRKLLFGLSFLFTSIAAVLISFCAGHSFIMKDELSLAASPIYTVACLPITFFAFAELPIFFDLIRTITSKVPCRR